MNNKPIDITPFKRNLRSGGFGSFQLNRFAELLAEALPDTTDPLMFLLEYTLLCSSIDKSPTRSVRIRNAEFHCSFTGSDLTKVFMLGIGSIMRIAKFPQEFIDGVREEMAMT